MPKSDAPAPLVAELQAERFGMPVIDADRSRLIAALHALINWLIENPGVPVANSVRLTHHPVHAGGVVTKVDLIDLANQLGGVVDQRDTSHWARAVLVSEPGVLVDYVVFAGDYSANARPL